MMETIFPIYKNERKNFILMGLMMFFILFNYTVLRDTKDTLVVTAAGGEALSLIKLIGTVPGAILIMLLYSKLSNILTRQQMFYVTLMPFVLFFSAFSFIIYPHLDVLHPSKEFVSNIASQYPRLSTVAHVFGNWSFALFYVFSELWGSVVFSLLFWQFANDHVKMDQAKRFYPLFGVIANVGAIAAGVSVQILAKMRGTLPAGTDPWGYSLNYLMGVITISSLLLMVVYYILNQDKEISCNTYSTQKKNKKKGSLIDSFKTLIRSKHLAYIALLVICYGVSVNVIEAVWKNQIKSVFENMNDYCVFMGRFSMVGGFVTIVFMLIGGFFLRKFGWFFSASLTPVMILITGLIFFAFIIYQDSLSGITLYMFGMIPSLMAVWIGFTQNILSKSTKYSLFDPTKEMCYIPLDEEEKVKGKAAVDVIGARLGKSGGSFIQQFFLLITGSTLAELSPYLGVVVIGIVLLWLWAVRKLDLSLLGLTGDTENNRVALQST